MVPHSGRSSWFKCTQMKIIRKYNSFPNFDFICFPYYDKNQKQYLEILNKQKEKEMHLRMPIYDFDILLRSVQFSVKLQIAKIDKVPKNKALPLLYKTSWEFDFSYKLSLAKKLQLCLGSPHLISPEPCKCTGRKMGTLHMRHRVRLFREYP